MSSTLNIDEIVDYYDHCQVDYEQFWKLNTHLCMHYGYWDSSTPDLGTALINMNMKVAEMGRIQPGDLVLDAGCGVGGSSIFLASELGCRSHGISLSTRQIEQCRANASRRGAQDRTTFTVMNYLETAFDDDTFDVVWGVESVCYAYDKRDFLKDFFSNDVAPGTSDADLMQKWTKTWAIKEYADIEQFWSAMDSTGFEDLERRDVTANVMKSIKRLYSLFYPGLLWMYGGWLLRLRSKENLLNAWSTYYQYKAYKRDLWRYMFFSGRKPLGE
jgi:tocopherol O-methyltransferase